MPVDDQRNFRNTSTNVAVMAGAACLHTSEVNQYVMHQVKIWLEGDAGG